MRDDAPRPERVPAKRRQLESADTLDRWIAEWLASDEITPSERRRLEAEKARRRARVPDNIVGVILADEGVTPKQAAGVVERVSASRPTEIRHTPGFRGRLGRYFPHLPVGMEVDAGVVVRGADLIVAAPRHEREPEAGEAGVWASIRYARHRRVPVRVILPSGKEL